MINKKIDSLILIMLCTVLAIQCSQKPNPYKGFTLPESKEYTRIIHAILIQDTAFIKVHNYIGYDLSEIKLITIRTKAEGLTIDTIVQGDFKTSVAELNYYGVTSRARRASDSLFFAFQNDSTPPVFIDTTLISFNRLVTHEVKIKHTGRSYFGYFQFSCPLLNYNKTKAFVQVDFVCQGLCGEGKTYVLDKINEKWIITLVRTRWVG